MRIRTLFIAAAALAATALPGAASAQRYGGGYYGYHAPSGYGRYDDRRDYRDYRRHRWQERRRWRELQRRRAWERRHRHHWRDYGNRYYRY